MPTFFIQKASWIPLRHDSKHGLLHCVIVTSVVSDSFDDSMVVARQAHSVQQSSPGRTLGGLPFPSSRGLQPRDPAISISSIGLLPLAPPGESRGDFQWLQKLLPWSWFLVVILKEINIFSMIENVKVLTAKWSYLNSYFLKHLELVLF